MNFFVATLGRSGTNWLAELLNKSEKFTVEHERMDGRDPRFIHPYSPFPIERFARPDYGEVHGFLRYSLSAGFIGPETMVPRRVLLERCPFAVIKSWMQCGDREGWEFSAVVFEVLTQQRLLKLWADADLEVRQEQFEVLTTDLEKLKVFCAWLELDYEPTQEDMMERKCASEETFQWTQDLVGKVNVIAERQGIAQLSPKDTPELL